MNGIHSEAMVQAMHDAGLIKKTVSEAQVELIKKSMMPGATDDELKYFINVCNHAGLDPFHKQIFAVKRRQKVGEKFIEKYEVQISIDGLRVLAERTGAYDGQDEPEWCGIDGVWKDIWLSKDPPAAARVRVYKKGISRPFVGIALYKEFVQTFGQDNKPGSMWAKMPANQLAKCAESQAFRKASFRHEFAHLTVRASEYEYDEPENESEHATALLCKPESALPPPKIDAVVELHRAKDDLARAKSGILKMDAQARIEQYEAMIATSAQEVVDGEVVSNDQPDASVISEIKDLMRKLGANNVAESKTLIARMLGFSIAKITVEDLTAEQIEILRSRLVDKLSVKEVGEL